MAKFDELVDECEEDMFSIIAQDGPRKTAYPAFVASVMPQNRGFWNRAKSEPGTFGALARKYYNNRKLPLAPYVLTLAPSGYTLEFTDD